MCVYEDIQILSFGLPKKKKSNLKIWQMEEKCLEW